MSNKKVNIVYVCIGNTQRLNQLKLSSYSAKKVCDCNIIVATDNRLIKAIESLPYVDKVICVDNDVLKNKSDVYKGLFIKTNLCEYVNDDFVYMDIDTIVLRDICSEFRSFNHSVGFRKDWNRCVTNWRNKYLNVGIDNQTEDSDCICNGGFYFCKYNAESKSFFKEWNKTFSELMTDNDPEDQSPLAKVIKGSNIDFQHLPYSYNAIEVSEFEDAYVLHYLKEAHNGLVVNGEADLDSEIDRICDLYKPRHYNRSVLTYIIGDYEKVHEIKEKEDGVEYVIVTDNPKIQSRTWNIVYDNDLRGMSCFDKVLYIRYHPFKYVNTNICLKIDSSIEVLGDLHLLFDEFERKEYDISLMVHPQRSLIADEYAEWELRRNYPHKQSQRCMRYIKSKLGADILNMNGLYQTGFQIQRNNDKNTSINERTYKILSELGVNGCIERLDQTIFSAVFNKYGSNLNSLFVGETLITDSNILSWYFHKTNDKIPTKSASVMCQPYAFGTQIKLREFWRKKKLLVLSMSCNKKDFVEEENVVRNTWAKHLIETDNADWYAYRGGALEDFIDKSINTIHLTSKDDWLNTFEKTSKCFDFINYKDYEWVLRTNCCVCIDTKALLSVLDLLEKGNIYTNEIVLYQCGDSYGIHYAGSFMLLDSALLTNLQSEQKDNSESSQTNRQDDVAYTFLLKRIYGKDYHKHIIDINSSYINEDCSNSICVKCKLLKDYAKHYNVGVTENLYKAYNNMSGSVNLSIKNRVLSSIGFKVQFKPYDQIECYCNPTREGFTIKQPVRTDIQHKEADELKTAIICIVKNENQYIKEWVDYHLNLGFDTIFVNDNNDIEGESVKDILKDYVKSKKVVILNRRGEVIVRNNKLLNSKGLQEYCMEECYHLFQSQYDWFAIIDIDEFICLDERFDNSVKAFLSQPHFDSADMIKMKWLIMDDNDSIQYSEGNVVDRFPNKNYDCELNNENKCFYRSNIKNFELYKGTHNTLNPNDVCCATDGSYMIANDTNTSLINRLVLTYQDCYIKHYATKSLEEYCERKLKGNYNISNIDFNYAVRKYFECNKKTQEKITYFANFLVNIQQQQPVSRPLMSEDNTKIFILGYKQFKCPIHNSNLYRIVNLTADNSIKNEDKFHYDVPIIYTDKKNSISNMNNMYDEWCGIYWLWKNYDWSKVEYVGLCQYRRYFEFLDNPDWDYLNCADINIGQGRRNYSMNNGTDYKACHSIDDLSDLFKVFATEEKEATELFFYSKTFFPSNLLILHKKDFFDLCAFAFGYIKKFQITYNLLTFEQIQARVMKNINKYPKRADSLKYQSQMLAFLMERLTNIWINKQLLAKRKIRTLPCFETEMTGQGIFKQIKVEDCDL